MPAKSAKQKRFMRAVAENPEFAKKVDVPQSVGKEYIAKAAGGRTNMKKQTKMARGGKMPMTKMKEGGKLPMVEKDGKMVPAFAADGKGKMARGGMTKTKMARGGSFKSKCDGAAQRGKTRGKVT